MLSSVSEVWLKILVPFQLHFNLLISVCHHLYTNNKFSQNDQILVFLRTLIRIHYKPLLSDEVAFLKKRFLYLLGQFSILQVAHKREMLYHVLLRRKSTSVQYPPAFTISAW